MRLDTRLASTALRERRFDLGGTRLDLDGVSFRDATGDGADATTGWWGHFAVTEGDMVWSRPLALSGGLTVEMKDADLLLSVFAQRKGYLRWFADVLDLGKLSAAGRVRLAANAVVLDPFTAESGKLSLRSRLRFAKDSQRGDLLVRYGVLGGGDRAARRRARLQVHPPDPLVREPEGVRGRRQRRCERWRRRSALALKTAGRGTAGSELPPAPPTASAAVAEPELIKHAAGGPDRQHVRAAGLGDDLLEEVLDRQRRQAEPVAVGVLALDTVLVEVKVGLHAEHAVRSDHRGHVEPEAVGVAGRRARANARQVAVELVGVPVPVVHAVSGREHMRERSRLVRGPRDDHDLRGGQRGRRVGCVSQRRGRRCRIGQRQGCGGDRERGSRGLWALDKIGSSGEQEARDLLALRMRHGHCKAPLYRSSSTVTGRSKSVRTLIALTQPQASALLPAIVRKCSGCARNMRRPRDDRGPAARSVGPVGLQIQAACIRG